MGHVPVRKLLVYQRVTYVKIPPVIASIFIGRSMGELLKPSPGNSHLLRLDGARPNSE